MYKYRYLIWGFLVFFMITTILLFASLFFTEEPTYEREKNMEKINEIFRKDEYYVYAMVPSDGYFKLNNASIENFKAWNEGFADQHIGFDDKNVYAGNIIIPKLSPHTLKILGNNYYTDGTHTYYVNRSSTSNELGALKLTYQYILHNFGNGSKPQTYWYPFVALPEGVKYQSKLGLYIAVSADKAYYKGELIPEANPQSLSEILIKQSHRFDRKSVSYFKDNKRIFYQNQVSPIPYDSTVYELDIEGDIPSRNAYLVAPQQGNLVVDGHVFDIEDGPFQLLSSNLVHANHVFVAGKKNIYYYDSFEKEIKKAHKNIFSESASKPIAHDLISSNNKIYGIYGWEVRRRKYGLVSRNTALIELKDVPANQFKLVSELDRVGSLYQYGERYFFVDNNGSSQLISYPIYECRSPEVAQAIMNEKKISIQYIRQLINNEQLFIPDTKKVFEVKSDYPNFYTEGMNITYVLLGAVILIIYLLRNKRMKPYLIKEPHLIINNLLFPKYEISQIDYIRFELQVVKLNYSGKMKIYMKDGTSSRKFLFVPRISFTPTTEVEMLTYFETLQEDLSKYGIKTRW